MSSHYTVSNLVTWTANKQAHLGENLCTILQGQPEKKAATTATSEVLTAS
jgi:hypothetical protein